VAKLNPFTGATCKINNLLAPEKYFKTEMRKKVKEIKNVHLARNTTPGVRRNESDRPSSANLLLIQVVNQ